VSSPHPSLCRANTHQLVLNGRLWPEMMCQLIGEKASPSLASHSSAVLPLPLPRPSMQEVRVSFTDAEGSVMMFSIRVLRGNEGGAKELSEVIAANKGEASKA
jgi:hypothetical protein